VLDCLVVYISHRVAHDTYHEQDVHRWSKNAMVMQWVNCVETVVLVRMMVVIVMFVCDSH
jgi:hypothetical protein